jgi:endonuclease G, mitochondrial
MDVLDRVLRVSQMLAQIAPAGNPERIVRPSSSEQQATTLESAEISPDPSSLALQKIHEGRAHEVTPAELYSLEAIVLPRNRPVVLVRGDSYDPLPDPWTSLNGAAVKARLSTSLPLIGRVEIPGSSLVPYGGTAFVVGTGRLMTNRHVALLFAQGLGTRIVYRSGAAAVNFRQQVDSPPDDRSRYLVVRGVEMIHPYWDAAILLVDGLPTDNALELSIRKPEDLIDRDIVAVGYPARDYRSDLDLQDQIFGGVFNVKRLQPGKVRQRSEVLSFENQVNAMTHDSSTLGGNSGSAIIDVESGQVIALHFAGEYLKANYAVPMYELARDARVAPKLNFDGSLAPSNDWEPAWRGVETDEAALRKPRETLQRIDSTSRLQHSPGATAAVPVPPADGGAVTWTISLRVTVSLGAPTIVSGVSPGSKEEVREFEESVVVDQDYSDREGYQPDFLGEITVPLPALTQKMATDTAVVSEKSRKNGNLYELAYHHYSVYMNKTRRTAWFSAANIDGAQRPDIGKRAGDRWYVDPRISSLEQLSQRAFEPGIDRGHLTRREDTAWGRNKAAALAANNDTFHFTNCSLQASLFNRGKDRWQGLEQFLLEQHAKQDKRLMTVITGPLFADNDPVYRNARMDYSVRCPLQFWKVCILVREDGTPSATGFILGQEEIARLAGFTEAFDVAAAQVTIAELAERTGLNFGALKEYDHFALSGPGTLERTSSGAGTRKPINPIRVGADIFI